MKNEEDDADFLWSQTTDKVSSKSSPDSPSAILKQFRAELDAQESTNLLLKAQENDEYARKLQESEDLQLAQFFAREEEEGAAKRKFLVNPAKKKKKTRIISHSSDEEEEEPIILPPEAKKKKRILVMSDSEEEEEEVVVVVDKTTTNKKVIKVTEAISGGEEDFSSSDDDDDKNGHEADAEREVQRFIQKCEIISQSITDKLKCSENELLDEAGAEKLVNNSALTLKPYQIAGVNWISILDQLDVNPVLADEMGLGKTITSCCFLRLKFARDGIRGPHLIVAPASTIENWQRELSLWLPELPFVAYNGSQEERRQLRRQRHKIKATIWLCTYTYFERESCHEDRKFLASFPFEVMILDEAHAIKNTESSRYQSLLLLNAKRKLLLTGTPCQNKLDELFALLSFCMPKSLLDTKRKVVREAVFGQDSDPNRVKEILKPLILRRLKINVLKHLVAKTEQVIELRMLPDQERMYTEIALEFKRKQQKTSSSLSLATSESVFTELRKCSNHPLMMRRRFGQAGREFSVIAQELLQHQWFGKHATLAMVTEEITKKYSDWDLNAICATVKSAKLRAMVLPSEDMFETSCKMAYLRTFLPDLIERGHRVLLFSQWTKLLDIFEEMLAQLMIPFMRLDGSTEVDQRQELMDEYNRGLAPVFLLSTRAGGLGINLTSADVVILHDLDFNPAIDSQAMDRCHRIGQTKQVMVYKLVTMGTVDESICKMQMRKTGLNRVLLGEEEEKESSSSVLLPQMTDFTANFQDVDDKELDKMKKDMIKEAVLQALGN